MKRWTIILVAVIAGGWLLMETVRDLFEAVRYFTSQPQALLSVVAIVLVGGLAALGFGRLSSRAQWQIRVFAWGAAAGGLTVFVVYFSIRFSALSSVLVESGGSRSFWLVMLLFSGIAVYLWFEFFRALRDC